MALPGSIKLPGTQHLKILIDFCLFAGVRRIGEARKAGRCLWIETSAAKADLKMKMGAGCPTGVTNISDGLTFGDRLTGGNRIAGQMPVQRVIAVPVVDHDAVTVPPVDLGKDHRTAVGSDYRRTVACADVDTGVVAPLVEDGMEAIAGAAGDVGAAWAGPTEGPAAHDRSAASIPAAVIAGVVIAAAGVPAADAAVRDKAGASRAIILSFGAAATAVAVPGYVIKRKEERRTGE